MGVEPIENENNIENKIDNPIKERASGILDTIESLIGVANDSENGEIPKAGKQAAEIEAESEHVEITQELIQTMITSAVTVLKMEVRSMIRDAVANLPQAQQNNDPFADRLTDRQLTGEDPY